MTQDNDDVDVLSRFVIVISEVARLVEEGGSLDGYARLVVNYVKRGKMNFPHLGIPCIIVFRHQHA